MDKNKLRMLAGLPVTAQPVTRVKVLSENALKLSQEMRALAGIPKSASASRRKLTESQLLRLRAGILTEDDIEKQLADATVADASAPTDVSTDAQADAGEVSDSGEAVPEEQPDTGAELLDSLKTIATHAEGKTGDELLEIIKSVYDAGLSDGKAEAENPEEDSEEVPADGEEDADADADAAPTEEVPPAELAGGDDVTAAK